MRILIGMVGLALLTGCVSSPVPVDKARLAPPDRVTAYQEQVNQSGQIVVIRDSGYFGSGCYATVFLNGHPVARLNPSEKAYFNVPAGEWQVGAALDGKGLCGANAERLEVEAAIQPGQSKKFRIFTPSDGAVQVKSSTF